MTSVVRLDFKRNFKYWLVVAILLAVDFSAGWIAFGRSILPVLKEAQVAAPAQWLSYGIVQMVWIILLYAYNGYQADPTLSRFGEIQALFKITLVVVLAAVVGNEVLNLPVAVPSSVFLKYWIIFVLALSTGRLMVRHVQKLFLRKGYGRKNTLVVGLNHRAQDLVTQLSDPKLGYHVVGFVTPNLDGSNGEKIGGVPVLGSVKNLTETIQEHRISEVVIALEKPNHDRLLDIITLSNGSPVSLKIIPDMYEVVSGLAKTEQLYGVPLIQINPEIITPQQKFFKRLIDIAVSLLVLVALFPVWVLVSIAIKIDSRGPILYRQDRLGRYGRKFIMYKFRSMVHNAESRTGPIWAREDDPRITATGRFLRRFRLDEIPQFLNVVKGDMSVVGPRPERPFFVQQLMAEFPFYYRRFKLRPGITGWAQIKHAYDSSLEDVRQKLKYDFFYIENLNLSLDFLIMFRTLKVMISGKGQ
ncbi:MAG: sugar transferase [Fidelibacterota bacterium]